ncbi:Cysteine-rich protein 2-binding protein [Bulinus truncatus]|nr:Cysteine-rich protein 2-binding protein [Bulinus truncatus]
METTECASCVYCGKSETDWNTLLSYKCQTCGKNVHYACIRSSHPSPLLDDTFFNFNCELCGGNKREEFERISMSWHNVVLLTLYNLQKTGQGKCGFFHWKKHICAFIEAHWTTFFGLSRKRTTLWMGTVAGTLSSGCPQHFISGGKIVDQGYWQLAVLEPPLPRTEKKRSSKKKSQCTENLVELFPESRKCKRSAENPLVAAIQLKEKRTTMVDSKRKQQEEVSDFSPSDAKNPKPTKRRSYTKKSSSLIRDSPLTVDFSALSEGCVGTYVSDDQDSNSIPSSELSTSTTASSFSSALQYPSRDIRAAHQEMDFANDIEVDVDEIDDEDLNVDIGSFGTVPDGFFDLRPSSPDISDILNIEKGPASMLGKSPVSSGSLLRCLRQEVLPEPQTSFVAHMETPVKDEPHSDVESEGQSEKNINENEEDSQNDDEESDSEDGITKKDLPLNDESRKSSNKGRPRKRRRLDDAQPTSQPPRLKRISVFEEGELLQKLNLIASKQTLKPELAQLRRKLICNQTNREYGLPVFDLEIQMERLAKLEFLPSDPTYDSISFLPKLSAKASQSKETRDLDRFMMHPSSEKNNSREYTSFRQRLVGLEDHELKPMVSPYTTRVLLPFIWRNYHTSRKPLKIKLLQEIQAYPHRHDPSWVAPDPSPIDYCYVRAEHIPSVNALCREFFWPGIDMSECLQYPDFSCVVLYRKIVIAFAFMVPDRGYNEAYISFIFTHPEWRGAGIATFMGLDQMYP